MSDAYGTIVGGLIVSVISTNRGLVFALSLPWRHVMRSLVCHTRWPELQRVDVTYYGSNVVPMCHLNDGTGCYVQIQGTILIVGGAV
jgi:hypothetical protein